MWRSFRWSEKLDVQPRFYITSNMIPVNTLIGRVIVFPQWAFQTLMLLCIDREKLMQRLRDNFFSRFSLSSKTARHQTILEIYLCIVNWFYTLALNCLESFSSDLLIMLLKKYFALQVVDCFISEEMHFEFFIHVIP